MFSNKSFGLQPADELHREIEKFILTYYASAAIHNSVR